MSPDLDHATSADRLGTSLDAKRARAVGYLRARGKYLLDPGTQWRPTPAVDTDVSATMARALQADMLVMLSPENLPALMRRQAA